MWTRTLDQSENSIEERLGCPACMAIYRGGFETCPVDGTALTPITTDPLVGTTIADQYVVDSCVGEGAMGRVYLAHHVRLTKRKFAIKVLLGDLAADPTMRRRFGQEAEAASRLQHPNVVSVLDFGKTEAGLHYLVMEFVEGGSLSDRMKHGALSEHETINLAKQICLGLTHAHEQGLVHRDFKPDNVALVKHDGKSIPMILDFGLAIINSPEESSVRLTSAGLVVGSPAYLSPEQSQGREVDQRTDLFALGVSLYEMLSGKLPFDGNVIDVLYKNAKEAPPLIAERSGIKVSTELEAIVLRLMEKDKSKRFANARGVFAALEGIESPSASVVRTVAQDSPPSDQERQKIESAKTMAAVETAQTGTAAETAKTMAAAETAKTMAALPPTPQSVIDSDAEAVGHDAKLLAASATTISVPLKAGLVIAGIGAVAVAAFLLFGGGERSHGGPTAVSIAREAVQSDPKKSEPEHAMSPRPEGPRAPLAVIHDAGPSADGRLPHDKTKNAAIVATNRQPRRDKPSRDQHTKVSAALNKEPVTSKRHRLARPDAAVLPEAKVTITPNDPPPAVLPKSDPTPKVATKAVVEPKLPSKPRVPTVFKATTSLTSFDSNGSLSDSKVRRSVGLVVPKLEDCYEPAARASKTNPAVSVKVAFKISENGRVIDLTVGKTPLTGLSDCIGKAIKKMRSRDRPDTGPQRVKFTLRYKPKS